MILARQSSTMSPKRNANVRVFGEKKSPDKFRYRNGGVRFGTIVRNTEPTSSLVYEETQAEKELRNLPKKELQTAGAACNWYNVSRHALRTYDTDVELYRKIMDEYEGMALFTEAHRQLNSPTSKQRTENSGKRSSRMRDGDDDLPNHSNVQFWSGQEYQDTAKPETKQNLPVQQKRGLRHTNKRQKTVMGIKTISSSHRELSPDERNLRKIRSTFYLSRENSLSKEKSLENSIVFKPNTQDVELPPVTDRNEEDADVDAAECPENDRELTGKKNSKYWMGAKQPRRVLGPL